MMPLEAIVAAQWKLHGGDCRRVLAGMDEGSVDSCVTDSPYELGFMGKAWDKTGVAFDPETWRAVLRVLKPGGYLIAFGGTRTVHRIACGIEDAGFEIRDQLSWIYGTGFPKSLNVGGGRGTALKPACEPICLARKPLVGTVAENLNRFGTGALNIDACRIMSGPSSGGAKASHTPLGIVNDDGWQGHERTIDRTLAAGRWPANVILDEAASALLDEQSGERKSGGRAGVVKTTGFQRDGETLAVEFEPTSPRAGDSGGASRFFYVAKASRSERDAGLMHLPPRTGGDVTDREDGTAGLSSPRAGAGRTGGARNFHPTVKPIELMRYLVRLVTPEGGLVLDPFTGSGTTGIAALREGRRFVGIEKNLEYLALAIDRIGGA